MTSTFTTVSAVSSETPFAQPVLAVIVNDVTALAVLARAVAAATALEAPLAVVLLHRRDGFRTDPALLAWTASRRERRLHSLLDGLRRSTGFQPVVARLPYGWRPPRSRDRLIARVIDGAARRFRARLVVAPSSLDQAVSQLALPAVVVPVGVTREGEAI